MDAMHADGREIFATTKEDLEHGIAGQMACLEKLSLALHQTFNVA